MNSTIRQMASDIFEEALKRGMKLEELRFASTQCADGGCMLIGVSAEIEVTHPIKSKLDEIIVGEAKQEMK